jgi:hypothetical protein
MTLIAGILKSAATGISWAYETASDCTQRTVKAAKNVLASLSEPRAKINLAAYSILLIVLCTQEVAAKCTVNELCVHDCIERGPPHNNLLVWISQCKAACCW